jgi:hypothetical protein
LHVTVIEFPAICAPTVGGGWPGPSSFGQSRWSNLGCEGPLWVELDSNVYFASRIGSLLVFV